MMYKSIFIPILCLLVLVYFILANDEGIIIKQSSIPEAGKGVFTTRDIDEGVTIGEYKGERTEYSKMSENGKYAWKLQNGKIIDAADVKKSNWLRYINDHRSEEGNNLSMYEHDNCVYYKTIKPIKKGSELFVSYGEKYWENRV